MKYLAWTIICLFLGCSVKAPVPQPEKLDFIAPDIQPMELKPIKFMVLTENNVHEKFNELIRNNQDPVFIALSVDAYNNLSINMNEIMGHVSLQRELIESYRRYYEKD